MVLNVEPHMANFPASGGNATHRIISETPTRVAFKVKSSNNDHYRVRPVYGFIEANGKAPLELQRVDGPARSDDKIVIQWAPVPDGETDPSAPFKANAAEGEVILPVKAE